MTEARSPAAEYLRFLAWVAGAVILIIVVGALPTRRLGGEAAIPAMIAGCVIGALASAAGGIPVALARKSTAPDPAARLNAMMLSMGLRLAVVVALGAAALAIGFERKPLLLWIAIGYLVLLAVDVRYAIKGF